MNQSLSNAPNGQPDTRDLPAPKLSRPGPLTDTELQHAAALLLRGFTLTETARELGRSVVCVRDLARREGIEPRSDRRRWCLEEDMVIEAGVSSGKPLADIAEELGRTVGALCTRINVLGGTGLLRADREVEEAAPAKRTGRLDPWANWCAANARLRERRVITGAAC